MENKWKNIYDIELIKINKNEYQKYYATEKDLCEIYKVTRNTVRKAIEMLKFNGFICKDSATNRMIPIKNYKGNKLFSITEINPNIESKIKYIHMSKYDQMGVCLKYFKEKYLKNELHSFEECYVRRDILPKNILANKDLIEDSIFKFIEEKKLDTISYSKRRIYTKLVGDTHYVFNILEVFNKYNELILHFNTISRVDKLDISYVEYR